jgi:hypothetical protein
MPIIAALKIRAGEQMPGPAWKLPQPCRNITRYAAARTCRAIRNAGADTHKARK